VNEQLNERWYQTCLLAVAEPDSEKFMKLVTEVSLLLDEKDAETTALRRNASVSQ
jgi:hypothetical protein